MAIHSEAVVLLCLLTIISTVRAQYFVTDGYVVFSCRDEGPIRAAVRWVREGGKPLKAGSINKNGRLEIYRVTPADSGIYICQAPRYVGDPGSELRVVLTVEKRLLGFIGRPRFVACPLHQATCGNGQCIARSAICDGKVDCSDGSDETSCHQNGKCEPNEYQCRNRKCILKTWICDAEDDCGDESDEQNCGPAEPGQQCQPVEFACASNNQCVLKAFHCDGQNDCRDKSDEIGCAPVYITKQPSPSNVKLNPGDTLTLVCEAVGVPRPLISWRLNLGNVPEKCTSTSVNGVGTLTCPNMQLEDSGAYSCEAFNNKGTIFAAPDAIVYVNRTADVCPTGYFNSEARSASECIRCFCFGKSTQCQSADLFIFNMPTPLGEGGTRLIGVTQDYNGGIKKDQQINNQYYYLPLRNGATVTKLADFSTGWSRNTGAHPYLTLPETYNGNQLTSYGGSIKYRLSPHSPQPYSGSDSVPDIIILGKYQNLVHHSRTDPSRDFYIDARLTPGNNWQKPSSSGLILASREDIMMTLDDVEMILLRADLNNAGVNITDFTMESAQLLNVGLGTASLVEECKCPEGYKGRSCEEFICPEGYIGTSCESCSVGYYKDKAGYCKQCNCNGHDCQLGTYDEVICNCKPPYTGPDCSTVGGNSTSEVTTRPAPPASTVVVKGTSPTIKIQEEGPCRLRVNWYKADGNLPHDRSQVNQSSVLLLTTHVQVSDSGKYICQANDSVSTKQDFATLKVPSNDMTPPTVSINPSVKEYLVGSRIELICTTTGNPAPRITWQRAANRALPRTSETYDALLMINNASVEDSGEYRCIASNAAGSEDRTAVITVRAREPVQRGYLKVSSTSLTLNEGQSTRMVCTATSNVPAGTINWIRQDGLQFESNVRSENGVLYVEVARTENQGVYICQTKSYDVNAVPVVLTVIPTSTLPPTEVTNITLSVNQLTILTGDRGTIECIPHGYPAPLIKWSKYQDSFGPGTSQRENTLIITNAQERDGGYYFCEGNVDNRPVVSSYVYVTIEKSEKASVEIYPHVENSATLGSEYKLHCYVSGGNPPPVVTWYRNGGRYFSPHVQILQNNMLRFQNIEVNDEGEYTCTATNEAGSVSATAILKVKSPPEIRILPQTYIQANRGGRVTVECRADGYPEPEVSIRTKSGTRVLVLPTPRMATLTILRLSDSDDGTYLCTAKSAAGTTEDEFVIRVDRGDIIDEDESEKASVKIYPQVENSATLGSEYKLHCYVSGGNPAPVVTWYRNGGRYFSPHVQILQNNMLRFQNIEVNDEGEYTCTATNEAGSVSATAILKVRSPPEIRILPQTYIQANRGGRVTVECRADGYPEPEVSIRTKSGTRVLVLPTPRMATLTISRLSDSDDGTYLCTAKSAAGTTEDEFVIRVDRGDIIDDDGPSKPVYSVNDRDTTFTAHLGDIVDLPCNHNLKEPVSFEWRREYSQLPPDVRWNDRNLHLIGVTEADAGIYVCRVTNNRVRVETRATLRIDGIVPKFNGDGWVAILTLKGAYIQFEIEISFKPSDNNGIILYNSQNKDGTGDYLILQLIDGIPEFTLKFDTAPPLIVTGDRPLQLNVWHTIRLIRNDSKVTMDVNNYRGSFVAESHNKYEILDLNAPLYIGGLPDQRPPELENSTGTDKRLTTIASDHNATVVSYTEFDWIYRLQFF